MEKEEIKDLKKRYLFWLYKTTKEALDRIERKFTQLEIDRFILKELRRLDKDKRAQKFVDEFNAYIQNKEKEALSLKYENKGLKVDYSFLEFKLKAVEKAIIKNLGKGDLGEIKNLYMQEMLKRIIEERANKT